MKKCGVEVFVIFYNIFNQQVGTYHDHRYDEAEDKPKLEELMKKYNAHRYEIINV